MSHESPTSANPLLRRTPRGAFARAALAALVLLLAAGPAAAQDRIRLVLLPMQVHSAEPPDYLRRGLSDMLASRLERIPDLDIVRVDKPEAATTRLGEALERARKRDGQFVLFGSFTRFGTGASLDVQCAGVTPATGDEEPLREIFVHSGSIGDVIPDLDDLVGKVARFVISDYSARVAAETGAMPDLPSNQIDRLEARITALEKAIAELTARSGKAAAAPAAGGAKTGAKKPGQVAKSP